MNSGADVSLFMAFTAGIISFISPCVLPLIPGYLSFISGISVDQLGEATGESRVKILSATTLFVAGFGIVFVALGASAGLAGSWLLLYREILVKVAGVLIIAFGLFTMELIKIPQLYNTKRFNVDKRSFGIWGALPLGMSFGFAWTPCVGPILASIYTMAMTSQNTGQSVVLLGLYALGLGVPFILTALFFNVALGAFKWIKKNYRAINIVSGVMLIAMGLLILTNKLTVIGSWLQF
jgi:cytochrome c-type biogenesis protein